MRHLSSLVLEAADATRVPAGSALAVDRAKFSEYITEKIRSNPNIEVIEEEVTAIPEGEIKAEYALPTMVDAFIKNGKMSVSVLSTDSVWFGVTYKEDKEFVAGELLKMHEEGKYPEKLF